MPRGPSSTRSSSLKRPATRPSPEMTSSPSQLGPAVLGLICTSMTLGSLCWRIGFQAYSPRWAASVPGAPGAPAATGPTGVAAEEVPGVVVAAAAVERDRDEVRVVGPGAVDPAHLLERRGVRAAGHGHLVAREGAVLDAEQALLPVVRPGHEELGGHPQELDLGLGPAGGRGQVQPRHLVKRARGRRRRGRRRGLRGGRRRNRRDERGAPDGEAAPAKGGVARAELPRQSRRHAPMAASDGEPVGGRKRGSGLIVRVLTRPFACLLKARSCISRRQGGCPAGSSVLWHRRSSSSLEVCTSGVSASARTHPAVRADGRGLEMAMGAF